jgi:transcription elongation factor Elf1
VITGVRDNKTWFRCPNCNQKLLKYDEVKGKSERLYIKCKNCKKEIEINIE